MEKVLTLVYLDQVISHRDRNQRMRDNSWNEAPSVKALRPEPVSIQIFKAEGGV